MDCQDGNRNEKIINVTIRQSYVFLEFKYRIYSKIILSHLFFKIEICEILREDFIDILKFNEIIY